MNNFQNNTFQYIYNDLAAGDKLSVIPLLECFSVSLKHKLKHLRYTQFDMLCSFFLTRKAEKGDICLY